MALTVGEMWTPNSLGSPDTGVHEKYFQNVGGQDSFEGQPSKGNLQMNFQLKTPTDQIYRLAFHWEHEFCQTSILELVVLLKFVIPPWRGEHVRLVTVLTPSCVVYGLFPKLTAINHLINFQFFMCFQGKYKSNMFRWRNFDVDYCLSEEVTVYFIVGPNCND